MTQSSHRRFPSSPHASKSKSSRPVLHRRGTSAVNPSISKLGRGHSGHSRGSKDCNEEASEFDMSASFLNFCAMCEKQITVPNNSLLYCSESCRRKDSCKPLSASLPSVTNMSSMAATSPPTSPPLSPRTIVAPMTPTRPIPAIRIPADAHDAKSDLDPTEWKPLISARGAGTSLASSDAWTYLSHFHGGDNSMLIRRPSRSSASLPALVSHESAVAVPSLTHTPSTVASSFSSTASDDLVSMYEANAAQRPLPSRHHSYFSAPKSVELIVPHVASVTEKDNGVMAFHEAAWETRKKTAPITMTRAAGQS
ncbi:hypothetical protein N7468_010542, partial [Penicillium chermesinum]